MMTVEQHLQGYRAFTDEQLRVQADIFVGMARTDRYTPVEPYFIAAQFLYALELRQLLHEAINKPQPQQKAWQRGREFL